MIFSGQHVSISQKIQLFLYSFVSFVRLFIVLIWSDHARRDGWKKNNNAEMGITIKILKKEACRTTKKRKDGSVRCWKMKQRREKREEIEKERLQWRDVTPWSPGKLLPGYKSLHPRRQYLKWNKSSSLFMPTNSYTNIKKLEEKGFYLFLED